MGIGPDGGNIAPEIPPDANIFDAVSGAYEDAQEAGDGGDDDSAGDDSGGDGDS